MSPLRILLLLLLLRSLVGMAFARATGEAAVRAVGDEKTTASVTKKPVASPSSPTRSGPAIKQSPVKAAMTEQEKIEYLLRRVGRSGCTFIRGTTEYSCEKAESHLRLKLDRAGKRIKTARDFIKYPASTSSISGKPYILKKPEGTCVPSGQWLTEELEKLEKNGS